MGVEPFVAGFLFLLASTSASNDEFSEAAGSKPAGHNALDDGFNFDEVSTLFSGEDPNPPIGYPKNYCHSCLEISRNAEKILSDPFLLKKIDYFVTTVCELVPSAFQEKCARMVEMYKSDAIMFLQDAFLEENFCNNTGICSNLAQTSFISSCRRTKLLSAMLPIANLLSKLYKGLNIAAVQKVAIAGYASVERENPLELQSNGTCAACLSVLEKIRSELVEPDKQLKIIEALLKACETEVFVYKCKKLIFAYGPIVITNIQKAVSLDLCHMVHICRIPKNQTEHEFVADPLPQITVVPTDLDVM